MLKIIVTDNMFLPNNVDIGFTEEHKQVAWFMTARVMMCNNATSNNISAFVIYKN